VSGDGSWDGASVGAGALIESQGEVVRAIGVRDVFFDPHFDDSSQSRRVPPQNLVDRTIVDVSTLGVKLALPR
jgi:hypothetical protein